MVSGIIAVGLLVLFVRTTLISRYLKQIGIKEGGLRPSPHSVAASRQLVKIGSCCNIPPWDGHEEAFRLGPSLLLLRPREVGREWASYSTNFADSRQWEFGQDFDSFAREK